MKIIEVCAGMPRTVYSGRKLVSTGIFKLPVQGEVYAGIEHLAGDGQADLTVHGGQDKALYAYSTEHYPVWAKELGVAKLESSQFGENLTVSGMLEDSVMPGDRYRFGHVIAVVTQPRLPCFKLGIRMGDDTFPNRFLKSGRLGFYLRVEQPGVLQAGDPVELLERAAHRISISDLWQMVFGAERHPADAQRALDCLPFLDAGWQRRLRQIVASGR
ncbi:MAG: MOSC domain-containing protein [Woeseiaceae bacterium]|nr:MOSC domain-containing protein [Woeseiaceae bacterium]